MFAVSMIGKHKMSFSKHATLTEAKEKANEQLKNDVDYLHGRFDYAEIYDQTSKERIRKDGIGSEWRKVDEQ